MAELADWAAGATVPVTGRLGRQAEDRLSGVPAAATGIDGNSCPAFEAGVPGLPLPAGALAGCRLDSGDAATWRNGGWLSGVAAAAGGAGETWGASGGSAHGRTAFFAGTLAGRGLPAGGGAPPEGACRCSKASCAASDVGGTQATTLAVEAEALGLLAGKLAGCELLAEAAAVPWAAEVPPAMPLADAPSPDGTVSLRGTGMAMDSESRFAGASSAGVVAAAVSGICSPVTDRAASAAAALATSSLVSS